MKKKIQIGSTEYSSKKEALENYKIILNSYDFDEELNEKDFNQVIELLETHPKVDEKIGVGIKTVKVSKLIYNTKGFELVRFDGSTEFFSYTKRINSPSTLFTKFSEACRQAIQNDMNEVKLSYFKKHSKNGKVKCQESNKLSTYEELNVDHRQPNTFSVIVDRFIEVNGIDIKNTTYILKDGCPNELSDINLKTKFQEYHKEKANLRLVRKDLNKGRSYQARIKRQKKDLTIE